MEHGKNSLPEAQAGVRHSLAPNRSITWLSPKTAGPGGSRRHPDHHYSGILRDPLGPQEGCHPTVTALSPALAQEPWGIRDLP